jgi:penicillin G amidase
VNNGRAPLQQPRMAGPAAQASAACGCTPRKQAIASTIFLLLALVAIAVWFSSFQVPLTHCPDVVGPISFAFCLVPFVALIATVCYWKQVCGAVPSHATGTAALLAGEDVVPHHVEELDHAPPPAVNSASKRTPYECFCCISLHFGMVVCLVLSIALFGGAIFALWLASSSAVSLQGSLTLPGLAKPVNVVHDASGVVHIEAEGDLADAFFAQGVVHAQMRLWQMEFQRRVGSGTLSAVVGSGGLAIDKTMRTLGVYNAAKSAYRALPVDAKMAIDAYVSGVNAYLDTNPPLSLEFKVLGVSKVAPWRPEDSLVWAKLMSYDLSGNMDAEMTRYMLHVVANVSFPRIDELFPPYNATRFPTALSPRDLGLGSRTGGCNKPYVPDVQPVTDEPFPDGSDSVSRGMSYARSKAQHSHGRILTLSDRRALKWPKLENTRLGQVFRPAWEMGALGASNDWVVGGVRTKSGKPLLCNDPHLSLMAPSIWLATSLSAPQGGAIAELNPTLPAGSGARPVNIVGSSFVGLPGIVLGHNEYIAWGVTNVGADVQDLYVMFDPTDGTSSTTHYKWQGGSEAYSLRQETIEVAGSDPVVITVRTSRFGPVVTDNGLFSSLTPSGETPVPLSLRWVSTEPSINDTTLASFLRIGQAHNFTEWQNALEDYIAPSQNMIYADVNNHIGYRTTGYVPIRAGGRSGRYPVAGDGQGNDWDWTGRVPYMNMPWTMDPEEGFIATANNRIVPSQYPYLITGDWDAGSDGYRAERITDMICSPPAGNHTITSMQAIQLDYTTYLGRDFVSAVQKHFGNGANANLLNAGGAQVRDLLLGWDLVASVGSVTQTHAQLLYASLARLGSRDARTDLWQNSQFIYHALMFGDPACSQWGNDPTCATFLGDSLNQAATVNSTSDRWGSPGMHMATFKHQVLGASPLACLANRKIAHGGDFSTVNVGAPNLGDPTLPQSAGPSYRQVVDLANMQNSVFLNPLGQSGNILSPLYDNLLRAWSEGAYLPMTVASQDATATTQTLKPS